MKILLLEDETRIANFVISGLKEQGFHVVWVDNGSLCEKEILLGNYDAIIMDIMVPGKDGIGVLKSIRNKNIHTPVILLTARDTVEDKIEGLNAGADDYLAKPFYTDELIARIHAVTRRVLGERQNKIVVGTLTLDRITRTLTHNQEEISLTNREFNLLEYLMRSPNRVFTRTQILEHVWGYDFDPQTNIVDACVQRIRKKITACGGKDCIESVRGVGYRYGTTK